MAESHDERPDSSALGLETGRRQLEAVYRAEAPRLTRMLRGKLRGADESRDILQEAFARLAASRPGAVLRNPEAYLQRIVRNLLIDRSRRFAATPLHVPITEGTQFAVPPDQAYAIEVSQMRDQYRAVVAALPPRTRQVFLLHRVDELQYSEIAARLEISVRTVEWHISQAISKIGKALEHR
ncbi:MAG: polymerase ECF-type sigma factor [Novosphingobium sp.]|nr:polymerase ECF-type sigma factor [Novosphingobium sp.]